MHPVTSREPAAPRAASDRGEREQSAVNARVVVLGIALSILVAIAAFYADLLYFVSSRFTAGAPATAPFALLFLLAALASAGPLGRALRARRRELLAIYAIVLAGAPLVSHGVLGYMLPHSIFQQYGASFQPEWRTVFLPLLPSWFSPTEAAAVESFFHGGAAVPWSLWWTPLGMWCSFLVALAAASVCLALLLQRQWITNERLSFPLAQIPLGAVDEAEDGSGRARLPVSRLFWLGFALAFAVRLWDYVAGLYPSLPAIPLGPIPMISAQPVGPLAGLGEMDLTLWPWLIGIAYLIPKELSFSCWFFWIVRVGLAVIAIAAGATPRSPEAWLGDTTFPAFAFQGFGAIIALTAWAFWRARRHLARSIRIAFGRQSGRADADEPLPYRWALLGLALSFAWLVFFCCLIGCRVFVAVGLIATLLAFYVAWTWMRAETGLALLLYPSFLDDMADAFGNGWYRPQEIVTIMSVRWTYFNGATQLNLVPGNVLESLKIADSARIPPRPLFAAMAAAFFVFLIVGVYVTLTGIYRWGFSALRPTTETWLESQVRWGAGHIYYALTSPSQLEPAAVIATAAGAAVALTLGLLRMRFWWWPFHPVGYLAANSWGMHWFYSAFFLGWIAKSAVTRYGGLRAYRRTMPIAIGLIAGELMSEAVWAGVRLLLHHSV